MSEVRLSSKNQIVIPRSARAQLRLKPADILLVVVRGDMIVLMRKPRRYSDALRRGSPGPFPKHYLQRERASW